MTTNLKPLAQQVVVITAGGRGAGAVTLYSPGQAGRIHGRGDDNAADRKEATESNTRKEPGGSA